MSIRAVQMVIKWGWMVAVVGAAIFYMRERWDAVVDAAAEFTAGAIVVSVLLVLLSKLMLSENAFAAAQKAHLAITRTNAYRLYNMTQLGKYIPGSVWQYVGRGVAYRQVGGAYKAIRDAIVLETGWVLLAASLVGLLLAGPGVFLDLARLEVFPKYVRFWPAGLAGVVLLLGALFLAVRRVGLEKLWQWSSPPAYVVILQVSIWITLGLSFWVLLDDIGASVSVPYATGIFALAYAIGFLAFFAPAGIGVREGVLVFGLSGDLPLESTVAVVVVARLVYVVVEVLLATALMRKPCPRDSGNSCEGRS